MHRLGAQTEVLHVHNEEPRARFLADLEQGLRVGLFILMNEIFDCGFSKTSHNRQNVNLQSLPI